MLEYNKSMEKVITLNKTKLILLGIIGILIVGLAFSLYDRGNALYTIDKYQNQIDSLDSELVILQQEQTQFEIEIQKYKDSLIVYDHKIDSINLNIENIRNYYGKKINNIRNSSPTELYNFLTDRYK
jgi:cell division protein FtsB